MKTEQQSRRKGNVARLPKELRDKINSLLDDGATYPGIIAELEKSTDSPLPYPVSVNNLSNWKQGGYQDYLRNQSWRERIDAKADRYLDIALNDGASLVAGGLYAAAIQICELMDELAAAKPGETDFDKCARLTNTLSRISRSILMLQQHREAIEQAKAAEPDPKAQRLTEEEKDAKMREIFGLGPAADDGTYGPPPPPPQISAQLNPKWNQILNTQTQPTNRPELVVACDANHHL